MRRPTFLPRKLGEIAAYYDAFRALGYPVTMLDPDTGEPVAETLQIVRDEDRTNWLTVYGICLEALQADLGDLPLTIFVTSDREYTITFAQCAWLLGEMRTWGIDADANWRRLNKLARAAETNDELRAIDVTEGYP